MTFREAEEHLLGLEQLGMRFGLDRMHELMTRLGTPQRRFASIHVVGSNGKSSTARMVAAILEREGLRTGLYTSPHLRSFSERVEVAGEPLPEAAFAAAVERVVAEGREVTQFEALTAAAYQAFAAAEVEVAVIEAGLGGRDDATNVIPSKVQVLTTVGLEHTRWLGSTIEEIAREKLGVVRDGSVLVTGPLVPEARGVVLDVAASRNASHVEVTEPWTGPLGVAGAFQRTNFAVAVAAAGAFLEPRPVPLEGWMKSDAVRAAAGEVEIPGRLEQIATDPLTLVDAAHNPQGAAALAQALEGQRFTGVVSILDDKDARGILKPLLPLFDRVVFTRCSNPRAQSPAALASLSTQLSGPASECIPSPREALRRAQSYGAPTLATGSIYLIADLVAERAAAQASTL